MQCVYKTRSNIKFVCVGIITHSDDVILPEAQFIIIVSLKVKQCLCPSPPVAGHNEEVFMVSLVALHGVVRSQVLQRQGERGMIKSVDECCDLMVL